MVDTPRTCPVCDDQLGGPPTDWRDVGYDFHVHPLVIPVADSKRNVRDHDDES